MRYYSICDSYGNPIGKYFFSYKKAMDYKRMLGNPGMQIKARDINSYSYENKGL
jgi:hypothetical protein